MQVQIEHMCAQAAAGKVERRTGAGGGFEEQIGEGDAGKLAAFIGGLSRQPAVGFRTIENRRQCVPGQTVERNEVAQAPGAVLL